MSNDLAKTPEMSLTLAYAKLEIDSLMEQAKLDKRDIPTFMNEAIALATFNEEIAASCIFSLPRKQKNEKTGKYEQTYIKGKSIRLAEIILSVYKNIDVKVRNGIITPKSVTAIARCMDLQNKTCVEEEATQNVFGTHNDAIKLAMGAAKSIAIRNAIFRLIPGAFSDEIYRRAVECALGNQKTFPEKRKSVFERISKLGIPVDRIYSFYDKKNIEDFTPDLIEEIIGIGSAIKQGDMKIDKAFIKEAEIENANQSVNDLISNKNALPYRPEQDTETFLKEFDGVTGELR